MSFFDRIDHANFLHDGSEVKCRPFNYAAHANELGDSHENDVGDGVIEVPVVKPDVEIPVVEVHLR